MGEMVSQKTVLRAPAKAPMLSPPRYVYGFVGFSIVVAIWYITCLLGVVSPDLLPRPDQVVVSIIEQLAAGGLIKDIFVSLGRVLVGITIGSLLAFPVGFVLAWYPSMRAMFEPVISFFRALPPIALIPLIIIYLGIGEPARVSILVYATFFASTVVIFEGVAAIEDIYVRAARSLGATEGEIFRKIAVPLIIPQAFVALRLSVGMCWATLVAAELLAANNGLGAVIQNASNFFNIPVMYSGIIIIGALSLIQN